MTALIGTAVTVLSFHFKSTLIRYPRRRGLAEASQFNPGGEDERYRYGPDASTTQLLQGPSGSELFTAGFRTGDRGDGNRLWNLAPLLNRVNAGTPRRRRPSAVASAIGVS